MVRANGITIVTILIIVAALFFIFHYYELRRDDQRKFPQRHSTSFETETNQKIRTVFSCKSTNQGRIWVTDDQGFVCTHNEWNSTSGCCQAVATKFSCNTCDPNFQCCREYEYCVSCCLRRDTSKVSHIIHKAQKPARIVFEQSGFDFCVAQCRTYSASVIHQNSYRSAYRYCYGDKEPPLLRPGN